LLNGRLPFLLRRLDLGLGLQSQSLGFDLANSVA
jgi:hypothetical protein